MNQPNLASSAARVNNNRYHSQRKPTKLVGSQLIPTILQHPDGTEAFCLVPVCDSCNRPILDQDDTNVCVASDKQIIFEAPLELMGRVGETEVRRLPGEVRFFHKRCDPGITPWFTGDQVFRKQRYSKVGGAA